MKKFILITALLCSLSGAEAQEGKTTEGDNIPAEQAQVPAMILDRFTREYPGISGHWTRDGENYRVEFVDPQSHLGHIIVYDRNGEVIRRESELDGPASPNAINSFYQKNYPGEQIRTWSVTEKDGSMSYYGRRNSELLHFDQEGNPLAAKKQGPEKSGREATPALQK